MFNNRPTFFIKKNSTLPKLKFTLSDYLMAKYSITEDMLENCAVTFSMQDSDSGIYKIANKAADLLVNDDFEENPSDEKYNLVYKFSLNDTSKAGIYLGEFKLDFLGENQCGKITLPNTDKITIVIQDSSTKTTVI
jgi:hypothetical protein